jgi:hypothetical protein
MGKRLIFLVILAIGGTAPAEACNCPKEQLIKEHGTVSIFAPRAQLGPVQPTAVETTTVNKPAPLPLLVPIQQAPSPGPTSLEWLLLAP